MSKKTSRSKKGNGSVPNFVFQPKADGSTSPLVSYGSAPNSPSALSSTGFNFGTSNPGSPALPNFNLGTGDLQRLFGMEGEESSPGNSPIGANIPTTSDTAAAASLFSMSSAFNMKRGASDNLDVNASSTAPAFRRNASDLAGDSGSAPRSPIITGSFSFGNTPSSPIAPNSPATSGFAFGSSAPFTTPSSSTGFPSLSFSTSGGSQASTSWRSTPGTSAAPVSATASSSSAAPTSTPVSMFRTSTATNSPINFSFGFNDPKSTPSTSQGFTSPGFTSQGSTSQGFTSPGFSSQGFSSQGSASQGLDSFSTTTSKPNLGFSISAPAASTSTPSFSFGKSAETPTSTVTSAFNASKPPPLNLSSSNLNKENGASSTRPAFSFSMPATGSSSAATSVATPTTSIPSFTFTTPTPTSPAATSSTTTTTATTSATTTPASPFTFTFGASKPTTEKKDDKEPIATSVPFTFGATTTSTSIQTPSAPAAINTVDPNKPNVFSFTKILEDLAKIAAQPPSQMYVSLVTPAVAGLQPNQTTQHQASFPIDNIMPTTQFAALPDQARKELGELEEYIRLEGQRCKDIKNKKTVQLMNSMAVAKKNTVMLSQQLDALESSLKLQKEATETLYESVKVQLRHGNDGCQVIEACKHPWNNARWLFGYSEDDDYFSLLARQLGSRLEEYKKCIWEIERTAESWSQNRQQSPQDIAHIMRAQNQAFLALSNKVASLHENVRTEKQYYYQYLKMYT